MINRDNYRTLFGTNSRLTYTDESATYKHDLEIENDSLFNNTSHSDGFQNVRFQPRLLESFSE
jgi:hypothetical protein